MKLTERYAKPGDLPSRIAVFPLKGAILLPRTVLPLHIFEPRYVAMLEHVIAGGRILGIVQPQGDGGDTGSPAGKSTPLRRIGCAGRVTAFQEQEDGRLMITLSGVARFEVMDEVVTDAPYRTCRVAYDRFAGDLEEGVGEDEVDRDRLLGVLKTYLEARKLKGDWNAILRSPTEHLINSLSLISPYGPEEKQALLEARSLKERAEVLVALAEMELAANASGGTAPRLQ